MADDNIEDDVPDQQPFLDSVLPRPLANFIDTRVRPKLPHIGFITLHYAYFLATCLLSSVIFWGSSTPAKSVRYIDAIFLATSAMTEAGLNTVNLSQLNTWQQIILFFLIMMGSAIFVSIAVIHVRKHAFETKLQELADHRGRRFLRPRSMSFSRRSRRGSSITDPRREAEVVSGAVRGRVIHDPPADAPYEPTKPIEDDSSLSGEVATPDLEAGTAPTSRVPLQPQYNDGHIKFADTMTPARRIALGQPADTTRRRNRTLNSGVGAHSMELHPRHSQPSYLWSAEQSLNGNEKDHITSKKLGKYVDTLNGYVGRNSQFHHLTEKERRKLGGIEYDALYILAWVVPLYFILFQLIGALGCGAWLTINDPEAALQNGLNPFWTGAFFAVSAFNNSGMALLDANAVALQTSYYMLLTLSLLILAGNTCFPQFLRLILWTMKHCIPKESRSERWQKWRHVLEFILEHPRRVYTNLFPSEATWWLSLSLVILNGIDWFAFEVLNIGNTALDGIPTKFRALDGLFQAFAVRAGGFYVVSISSLYPGTLVLYVLMMYLSAFPVTMTIRNTNVYEERSLAIFSDEQPTQPPDPTPSPEPSKLSRTNTARTLVRNLTMGHGGGGSTKQPSPQTKRNNTTWSRPDFIRQQLRGQLGHDLWWLGLAILSITTIETSSIHADPVNFSIFNIIFEVVSAYGTVGISVGVPWNAYSFCGAWHTASKLILCAVMLRGRHRGLPVAIDHAVLLPDSSLAWAEEEDGYRRRMKREAKDRVKRRESEGDGGSVGGGGSGGFEDKDQGWKEVKSGEKAV